MAAVVVARQQCVVMQGSSVWQCVCGSGGGNAWQCVAVCGSGANTWQCVAVQWGVMGSPACACLVRITTLCGIFSTL